MATTTEKRGPRALMAVLLSTVLAFGCTPYAQATPEERAPFAPTMEADKTLAHPGDEVVFRTTLPIGELGPVTALSIVDELPDGVAPLSVDVRNADGEQLSDEAGSATIDGQTAGFTFEPEWLDQALPETSPVTFAVTAQVGDDPDAFGGVIANSATITFGDDQVTTNTSTVVVAPSSEETPLVADRALRLTAARGGQTFTSQPVPPDKLFTGGYYLENAGEVPVALDPADISIFNGGIESTSGNRILVRDYTPSAHNGGTNFWVSARYRNYGDLVNAATGERIAVDVKTTITPLDTCATEDPVAWSYFMGSADTSYAYVVFHTPGMGISVANMPLFDQTWEFFKAGTDEPATIDGNLWVMEQSLDLGEGFACENVVNSYVSSTMPNRNDNAAGAAFSPLISSSSARSVIPGSNVYEFTQGAFFGLIGASIFTEQSDGGTFRWREPGEDDRTTTIAGTDYQNSHLWASGSLEVAMNGASSLTVRNYEVAKNNYPAENPGELASIGLDFDRQAGRHTGSPSWSQYGMKYYVTYFNSLTSFAPSGPSKAVDKAVAYPSETVTYTVEQPIGKWGGSLSEGTTYTSFTFSDAIPAGLTYIPGSLKARDTKGADVTNRGVVAIDGQNLSFAFEGDYLATGLDYDGGKVAFEFACTVDAGTEGQTLKNTGTTHINDTDFTTNEVTTDVPTSEYNSPVKAVDKAVAEVGETVTYTVTQKIHDRSERPGGKAYGAFSFFDELPNGLTYKAGSFSVTDAAGVDLTSPDSDARMEAYGLEEVGSLTVSGQSLSYAFDPAYLAVMPYNGADMTFTFQATVDEEAAGTTLKNTATTKVNDVERPSNEVETIVPEKVVIPEPESPTKQVDKEVASPGDSLTYTVKQPVGELPDGHYYTELAFFDELPRGAAPSALRVYDTNGRDVTTEAGTARIQGQKVTYSFKASWLQSTLGNASGELMFIIDARIDEGDPAQYGNRLVNEATLDFGSGVVRKTNQVVTRVESPAVPLPLTGLSGVALPLGLAAIAVTFGLGGLTLMRGRSRRDPW